MSREPLHSRWRREVYRNTAITDATRVLLLLLADEMDERGYVCIPRDVLAKRLNRNERKVSARFEDAVNARLLDRVVRGNRGVTAVYRAMVPGVESLPVPGSQSTGKTAGSLHPKSPGNRQPIEGERLPHGGPASIGEPPKSETPELQLPTPNRNEEKGSEAVELDPAEVDRARHAVRIASFSWTGEVEPEMGPSQPQTEAEWVALRQWAERQAGAA